MFPNILNDSQHLIYVSIGHVVSLDYENYTESCVDAQGPVLAVAIPYLTRSPPIPSQYTLVLAKMYDRRRGDIAKPNIAYPYIPVDELILGHNFAVIRNGSDEFRLEFTRYIDPCIPSSSLVHDEFINFTAQEMQIGAAEPNFDICDRHPSNNKFCSIVKSIKCDVSRVGPNFCQLPWRADDLVTCETSVTITNITSGFLDFMLLNEIPTKVIASESTIGHFPISIKYPCIVPP